MKISKHQFRKMIIEEVEEVEEAEKYRDLDSKLPKLKLFIDHLIDKRRGLKLNNQILLIKYIIDMLAIEPETIQYILRKLISHYGSQK